MWVLKSPTDLGEATPGAAPGRMRRVLITGASSPAAPAAISLAQRDGLDFFAADSDPDAPGLLLVPPQRRLVLPDPTSPDYVETLRDTCKTFGISIVIPLLHPEFLPLARARQRLEGVGVSLVLSPASSLLTCLEPHRLARACELVGIAMAQACDDDLPVLEVDVFVRSDWVLAAALPRIWESGTAQHRATARTLHDRAAVKEAKRVCQATGVRGMATVVFKRAASGKLLLVKVIPGAHPYHAVAAAAGINVIALALAEALGELVPDSVRIREVTAIFEKIGNYSTNGLPGTAHVVTA